MHKTRIVRIERATLKADRLERDGANAFAVDHGQTIDVATVRLTTDSGVQGWGWSHLRREKAEDLLKGFILEDVFEETSGVADAYHVVDQPLWDLMGRIKGKPVYELMGGKRGPDGFRVPIYCSNMYMADLEEADQAAGIERMREKTRQALTRGHTGFKLKIGRGAMHMPVMEGLRRDIEVIHAVREVAGRDAPLMVDGNNGFNVNLVRELLRETRQDRLFWFEEPLHENRRWSSNLKEMMRAEGFDVLIADGEGDASPGLLGMAHQGLIDVVQYDIKYYGLTKWYRLAPQLDEWNVLSAPHNYGELLGNYATCHIAGRIRNFTFVEWDHAVCPQIDASGYSLVEGKMVVPERPGLGLELDDEGFRRAVRENGYVVEC